MLFHWNISPRYTYDSISQYRVPILTFRKLHHATAALCAVLLKLCTTFFEFCISIAYCIHTGSSAFWRLMSCIVLVWWSRNICSLLIHVHLIRRYKKCHLSLIIKMFCIICIKILECSACKPGLCFVPKIMEEVLLRQYDIPREYATKRYV